MNFIYSLCGALSVSVMPGGSDCSAFSVTFSCFAKDARNAWNHACARVGEILVQVNLLVGREASVFMSGFEEFAALFVFTPHAMETGKVIGGASTQKVDGDEKLLARLIE
ncbi:MAG: hypothetical protein ABFS02_03545 [Pseudomonadota bacterium]